MERQQLVSVLVGAACQPATLYQETPAKGLPDATNVPVGKGGSRLGSRRAARNAFLRNAHLAGWLQSSSPTP